MEWKIPVFSHIICTNMFLRSPLLSLNLWHTGWVQPIIHFAGVLLDSVLFVHSGWLHCRCCVSTIPCCTIAWYTLPSALPTLKIQTVSWNVATHLASLSMSLSIVIKKRSPMSPFHRCSFTLKSYTNFLYFERTGAVVHTVYWTRWSSSLLAEGLRLIQE